MSSNPLLNQEFLKALDENNSKEVFAKIISLTKEEYPVEDISGKVSQGTISIDGNSSIRRTCSLTIVADRVNINEYNWGFSTKFKLYIGVKIPDDLKNQYYITSSLFREDYELTIANSDIIYIYKDYPDIIWFPQGLFLITSFKININVNGTDNIYITGKDKMALLNGEMGGHFPHRTDVGTIEEYTYDENGDIADRLVTPITLKEIIREVVFKYGNEPLYNIIINDLDETGLEMIDYNGTDTLYLLRNIKTGAFENILFDGDVIRYDFLNRPVKISEMLDSEYDTLSENMVNRKAKKLKATNNSADNTYYTIAKKSFGSILGYRMTESIYPSENGELIVSPGETVVSVLDKICNTFGNEYEYFYDLNGHFIFQKKPVYINTSWNNLTKTYKETFGEVLQESEYAESSKVVSQISYSFIGNKLTTMFQNNPNINNVKNDYAIWGKKKSSLTGKDNDIHMRYAIDEKPTKYRSFNGILYTTDKYDWRELIYQMAIDYYDHAHDDDYFIVLYANNPWFPYGKTGYESYYTDLLEFWRGLYNPNPEEDEKDDYYLKREEGQSLEDFNEIKYWAKLVFEDPSALVFWFDFLDGQKTEVGKYSVSAIGDRAKVVSNDKVKAIYYGDIPNYIFISKEDYNNLKQKKLLKDGYVYIILPKNLEVYFNISKKNKSAKDELDNLLYQYTYCNESITITSLPIYHLDVNTRIKVFDEKTKINGEYIINKIVLPLNYNGNMSISATYAPQRLY